MSAPKLGSMALSKQETIDAVVAYIDRNNLGTDTRMCVETTFQLIQAGAKANISKQMACRHIRLISEVNATHAQCEDCDFYPIPLEDL